MRFRLPRHLDQAAALAVFAALPTVGLVNGPVYAPLVFGLAGIMILAGLAGRRHPVMTLDLPLTALAASLLAWSGLSLFWSIDPRHSLSGVLQLAAVSIPSLALLSAGVIEPKWKKPIFYVVAAATLIGPIFVIVDIVLQYKLHTIAFLHSDAWAPTKYNRGIDYLLIFVWPVLAWIRRTDGWRMIGVIGAVIFAMILLSPSTTGRVEAIIGSVVLLLATRRPEFTARLLAVTVPAMALLFPFLVRLVAGLREAVGTHLKVSALHRLEIWDYMSARILERPLAGWGFWTAKQVPISGEELSHYVYADNSGIYPHNQWIGLWLECGFVGTAIALAAVLILLRRVTRLPEDIRPFAYAAFSCALVISNVNFEITTDSWWAALAATAFLFKALNDRSA